MKKLILLFSLITLVSFNVKSSHIYGGDLSCTQTGANSFIFKLRMQSDRLTAPSVILNVRVNNIDTIHGNTTLFLDSSRLVYLKNGTTILDSIQVHYYSGSTNLPNNLNGY